MKKKIVLCMILGCLSTALFGCTAKDVMDTVAQKKAESKTETETEVVEEEPEADKEEDKKAEEKEPETEVEEKKTEDEKEKKASDTPVLGDEDIEDYDGFEYLFGAILMTDAEENEETGKKERSKMSVFVPDHEYANVSGNRAYADYLGVDFRVELCPYIRYDEEDYLMEENLQYYLEDEYNPFYSTDYKDLVISEVEKLDDTAFRATAEYCYYNSWDDSYRTEFATYYYTEVEGKTVMVEVVVNEDEVTGKTPALIDELEQFYQFEIEWDADRAAQKREDYIASGGDNKYSTGYMVFELPEGWEEIDDGSYDMYTYGSTDGNCMVSFYREFSDEKVDVNAFIDNKTEAEAMLEEMVGMDVSNFSAEKAETALGDAAKLTYTISDGEITANGTAYFIGKGYYFYTMQALALDGAEEDPAIVLDGILQTAQFRD